MTLNSKDFMDLITDHKIDSRMKNPVETHPQYKLERTYCTVCGKPKGYVSEESSKHIKASSIVVVCDECFTEFGELPLEKADIKEYD